MKEWDGQGIFLNQMFHLFIAIMSNQRILFNPLDKPENAHIPDLNKRELALMAPLVAGIIWLGVYPTPVLRRMEVAATRFVQTVEARAAAAVANR